MRAVVGLVVLLVVPSGAALSQTFRGYDCTVDCSGHQAGYDWAERRGIDDADGCSGNSNSFIEGCRAYAEETGADLFANPVLEYEAESFDDDYGFFDDEGED